MIKIRNKITAVFWLFIPIVVVAQGEKTDSITSRKLGIAHNMVLANAHSDALALFKECAQMGSAQAMNAIGVMMQRGWGMAKNEAESVRWFEKAAASGYPPAFYNLAKVYEKGLGVEQDFSKAFDNYKQLYSENDSYICFSLGYYYYKGLGVEQNYQKAVQYFLSAAKKDTNADAYYFLGLCYRNGYGVEQNAGEAQYYLSKAVAMGHVDSSEELKENIPENYPKPQHVKMRSSESGNSDNTSHFRLIKQQVQGSISGEYLGKLLTYDFSGKNIVRETSLKVIIDGTVENNRVSGLWIEADTIMTSFEGILSDSTLQFINTSYERTDYYNKKQAVKWDFQQAMLEKKEIEGITYLTGNIQLYSPITKEPEKPMYITLRQSAEALKETGKQETITSRLLVYPNPFDSELNLSFDLENTGNVTAEIHGMNGVRQAHNNLGRLEPGRYNYILELNIPKGQYIFTLKKGNTAYSEIINKK